MKPKKCKVCQELFTPRQFAQSVCNYTCSIIHVKNLKEQKEAKEWRVRKAHLKEQLKTLSEYAKDLQKEVNTIVRLIDKGTQCISTLKTLNDKYDAGHFYSVGGNPALRFHLDNIHAQSVYANQYLSGDQMNYLNGLSEVYGLEYKEYVVSLKGRYTVLKLTIEDMKDKITISRGIVKWLKLQDRSFTDYERIELRKEYNIKLGMYN